MDKALEVYYRTGSLPEEVSKEELCDHLLSCVFPSKKIDVLDQGYVVLKNISHVPIGDYGTDYSVVESARVSLGAGLSTHSRDKKLVSFLKEHRHLSPFEHVSVTMIIKCPIPIARHFQRHRTFSFNEESARYTEVKDEMYIPFFFRRQSKKNRQCSTDEEVEEKSLLVEAQEKCREMYEFYQKLLDAGVAREQARLFLPQTMYTSFFMTGNLRNWMQMLSLRNSPDAQWEIQQYAVAIESLLKPYLPLSLQEDQE